ncbi:14665_t:CDS:10, partial [Acaulospora morrowiae]
MESQSSIDIENKENISIEPSPVVEEEFQGVNGVNITLPISPQTNSRRSMSTISTDSLTHHPLQNLDEEEIESLWSGQLSRRSPSSSSISSLSSLQPKFSSSHLVPGDSLGGLILAKLREMNDEFSDIIQLLIAKKATLCLPASAVGPFENVDRILLQDHVMVTQTIDDEIKVLTLGGLTGFIQKDAFKAIGLMSSEKDILTSITESQKNRKSIFDAFSKPNDYSREYPSIKIINGSADLLLHGMTIQTIVIESPIMTKEIVDNIETKNAIEQEVGKADLPEPILKEIFSFIEEFSKKPPQDEDSSSDEIQRLYENIRYHFESQLAVAGELAEARENEIDESMNIVEKYVCTSLYEFLFCPKWSDDGLQDDSLGSRIAALNILELNLSSLGVNVGPHQQTFIDFAVKEASAELQSLEQKKSPYEKLNSIIHCHKIIVDALEKRLSNINTDNNDKPSPINHNDHVKSKSTAASPASIPLPDSPTTSNGSSVPTSPTFPPEEKYNPNADVILPLLIFILIKSNPKKLVSNLKFIQRYRVRSLLHGESAYCFTNFLAAVSFLEDADYKRLGLPSDKVFSEPISAESTKVPLEQRVSRKVGQDIVGVADSGLKAITGVMDTSYKMIGRVFGYNENVITGNPSTITNEKVKENSTTHQHLTKTKVNDIVVNSGIPTEIIVRELAEINSSKHDAEDFDDGNMVNKNMQAVESKSLTERLLPYNVLSRFSSDRGRPGENKGTSNVKIAPPLKKVHRLSDRGISRVRCS